MLRKLLQKVRASAEQVRPAARLASASGGATVLTRPPARPLLRSTTCTLPRAPWRRRSRP